MIPTVVRQNIGSFRTWETFIRPLWNVAKELNFPTPPSYRNANPIPENGCIYFR